MKKRRKDEIFCLPFHDITIITGEKCKFIFLPGDGPYDPSDYPCWIVWRCPSPPHQHTQTCLTSCPPASEGCRCNPESSQCCIPVARCMFFLLVEPECAPRAAGCGQLCHPLGQPVGSVESGKDFCPESLCLAHCFNNQHVLALRPGQNMPRPSQKANHFLQRKQSLLLASVTQVHRGAVVLWKTPGSRKHFT